MKSNLTQELTNGHTYDLNPVQVRIISLTTCHALTDEAKHHIFHTVRVKWLQTCENITVGNYEIFIFCDIVLTPMFARMDKLPRKAIRHHGKKLFRKYVLNT